MRWRSFYFRLLLGNLALVLLILGVEGAVTFHYLRAQFQEQVFVHQDRLLALSQEYLQQLWPAPPGRLDSLVKDLGRRLPALENEPPLRLTVIAPDGQVLADSDADLAAMDNHKTADRPEVLAALDGRPGVSLRHSRTVGQELRYAALPIRHDGQIVAVVRMSLPSAALLKHNDLLYSTVFGAIGAALAAAIVLGLFLSWLWYAPLRRVTQTARQIASGDFAARARVGSTDELAQLATAINQMRDNLAGMLKTVQDQRRDLQTVVASLPEGIIGLDARGRITTMNDAARALFAVTLEQVEGQPLQAVVRMADVIGAYEQAIHSGQPADRQIELTQPTGRRTLDVHAAVIESGRAEGTAALVVARDVTDIVRAAAMKTEFVANASHELRTPLTTLRAVVESLEVVEPGDQQTLRRYWEIAARQVDRLESMCNDLLDLHRVERKDAQLPLTEMSFHEWRDWATGLFADRAQASGVGFVIDCPQADHRFVSDRKLLELILQNLLDNALKFTPAGGAVRLQMEALTGQALFRVRDTGCGISPADQRRVFERFFQADPARSGDVRKRGTGLGLAIVKHASERLEAWLKLESEPGTGTTVTVIVPDKTPLQLPDQPAK